MGFIRVLWVIFFLGFFLKAHAQTYPVQTNIVAVGPYYNYLNYYADENAHLQIITTLTDFNTAPVNVRLRIQFIGPGYTISTKPNAIIGQAFTLEPGIPLFINGIDLLPYFYETNVVKSPSGINLNSLPEGLTTVCVDVIRDGVSQEVLSTNNCTSFFLQRFQPPQGIFPQCGSNIHPDEGFYTFQWSPPIGYVPSIGSELNYTFSLYEWNDPNNYNIFQTGQGLVYQAYIQQPIVQLSNFDLTLQNGKNYVWRVQAQLLSNGLPVNMIENNGLSGICTFTYGTAQTLEESLADGLHIDISAMGEGERKGKASWTVIDNTPGEGLSTFSSYIVHYRKKPSGNEGYELTWFQDTVSTFNHFIYQLEPATTYEVKVAGRVGDNYVSEPSEIKEFTTYNPRAYACGDTDMPFRSQTYQPLAQAQAGMYFQIGQFSMQVTEISPVGATGHYQGKGLIPIAFLAGAKAKVKFDDILVDDKYMVREGIVEVMTKGLDQWLHEQYMQFIDPIYVSGTVDSAYVENGMAWVVIDGHSQSWEFDPPDYPIIVNDDSGTQYIIHPNGTITKSSYFEILEEWNDVTAQEIVTFSQNENETFGFDAKQHTQWHDNYDIIQLKDSSFYFAPNKSMGVGKTDVVNVNLPTGGTGTYTYKINNGTAQSLNAGTLTLPAQNTKGDFNLEVFQGTKKVGKLKLIVFEEKEINLVVVPLVGNTPTKTELETALNKTLGEANLKFNVTLETQWNNTTFTTSKTVQLPEDVSLLNKYSPDMASLRDAYFSEHPDAVQDAFYLFVVPGFSDNATDGYMVRGKSLGFVAANANLQTYVHELGHGVGALKHSWQDNGPAQGTTNNLMDYSENATNLIKAQWKQIRSWNLMPSMWDEAEDGMETSGLVAYYNVVINSNGEILSRTSLKKSNWLRTINGSGHVTEGIATELCVVNKIFNETGQFLYSVKRDPVVYYRVKYVTSENFIKTYQNDSKNLTVSQKNYNKLTNEVLTVKEIYNSSNKYIKTSIFRFDGSELFISSNGELIPSNYKYETPFVLAAMTPLFAMKESGMLPEHLLEKVQVNCSELNVNMDLCPSSFGGRATTYNYGRKWNPQWFWSEALKNKPEWFSVENRQLILKNKIPKADGQFIENMCRNFSEMERDAVLTICKETLLEHHHINHGRWAIGLPHTIHRGAGNTKFWHNTKFRNSATKIIKSGVKGIIILGALLTIQDLMAGEFVDPIGLVPAVDWESGFRKILYDGLEEQNYKKIHIGLTSTTSPEFKIGYITLEEYIAFHESGEMPQGLILKSKPWIKFSEQYGSYVYPYSVIYYKDELFGIIYMPNENW